MMKRLPDWPKRLHDFVDAVKRDPFNWGAHNCATFVAGAVEAMTGERLIRVYRFKTARGALSAVKRAGFDNLADMVASLLPEQHISRARTGDIAAIPTNDAFGFTLGIVNGEMILVLGEKSMGLIPLFDATRAFRVGD